MSLKLHALDEPLFDMNESLESICISHVTSFPVQRGISFLNFLFDQQSLLIARSCLELVKMSFEAYTDVRSKHCTSPSPFMSTRTSRCTSMQWERNFWMKKSFGEKRRRWYFSTSIRQSSKTGILCKNSEIQRGVEKINKQVYFCKTL